ncbi:MAG: TrkA C-terminal domain-containing protein, partial [Cyanobacteria bacterium J06631_2]
DYARLLHLKGKYQVTEITVNEDNWLANKKLNELRLADEGITILGIERKDRIYIGAPHGNTCIYPEDTLIIYGCKMALIELNARHHGNEGDEAHRKAVAVQRQIEQQQSSHDA